ncbi:MAG: hypothetical protein D6757_03360 [Alphaproteobacteria bacterium]|nr:MAG: hypothetical protein D6757_03360 [Alphaproteobacteria bacterium]
MRISRATRFARHPPGHDGLMSKHEDMQEMKLAMPSQAARNPECRQALSPEQQALKSRLAGTNIDETSFLATDYLNHFNEVVMLLEMAPEMPDILDEARDWQPISYEEHFRITGFRDKELAIEAYRLAPSDIRARFDALVDELSSCVRETLSTLTIDGKADGDRIRAELSPRMERIHALMGEINGVIHIGKDGKAEQAEQTARLASVSETEAQQDIDALFDGDAGAPDQDDIDALFDDSASGAASQDDIDALFD